MFPSKRFKEEKTERNKRLKITIELKHEIIKKREEGASVADLARIYNRPSSTICTILKNKDKIKDIDAPVGISRISTKRSHILDNVEKLLLLWINEKQMHGETINQYIICDKAKTIYADLIRTMPESSTMEKEVQFKGSNGWFEKFKRRSGIFGSERNCEAGSSDIKAVDNFISDFKNLIDSAGYQPQQVFNCDETGLFWKKMPKRTYITAEENALPCIGHKPMKDRLTLLFCANASGDLKIKPLLVYHSETPRAFKKFNVQKSSLNVMWRSNKKAWVTRDIFTDWINEVFGPTVKKYLLEMNLPLNALLVLDNAPAHPPGLQDDLLEEFNFIKIQFLPPKSTMLLQPMNQQIIYNFKLLYTKSLFERCFEVNAGTDLTLREFWKDHFNIVACLKMIDKAWDGVTQRTLISAWKELWPESVIECDFEGQEADTAETVIQEIVYLANIMELVADNNDINELVEEHNQELTTEELTALHRVLQQEIIEDCLSVEEEEGKEQSSDEIRKMLRAWETVASYIEKHHPNKAMAMRATNLFNDSAMSHFHQILKRRQQQMCLDIIVKKEILD